MARDGERRVRVKGWAVINNWGDIYKDSRYGEGSSQFWIFAKKPTVYRSDEKVVRVEIRELTPRKQGKRRT